MHSEHSLLIGQLLHMDILVLGGVHTFISPSLSHTVHVPHVHTLYILTLRTLYMEAAW